MSAPAPIGSIEAMTTTPPPTPPRSGTDNFFDAIRRTGLVRSDDRWVGGVSSGLALRLGIDPLIVRGLFGVATLLGGVGLILYGLAWLLLPEQSDGRIHIQQLLRGDFDAAVVGGFLLLLMGFAFPGWWFVFPGRPNQWWGGLFGLALVAVVIALIISAAARDRQRAPGTPGTHAQPPYPYGPVPTPPVPPTPAASDAASVPPYATAYQPTAHHAVGQRPEGQAMYPAPPPPRRRPRGAGAASFAVVMGLSLIILAVLLFARRIGIYDGPVWLAAGATLVILSGAAIVVAGLRGRTSGGLSALAIVAALVMLPFAALSHVDWSGMTAVIGEGTYTPRDVATAEAGYTIGAGDITIDLTEVPLDGPAIEVPLHLLAGELEVILPRDGAYTARVRVNAGEVHWLGERALSGVRSHGWETFSSPAVQDGARPDLELTITVAAGSLRVIEESR
jgi:phage shock protein PspC (stress-responsive transcriptional regulator)